MSRFIDFGPVRRGLISSGRYASGPLIGEREPASVRSQATARTPLASPDSPGAAIKNLGARSQFGRLGVTTATVALAAVLGATMSARAETPAPSPAATASPVPAPVEVHARVEDGTLTIGQRFRYTVEVAAPAAVEILLAQPTEHLGAFDIVDFGDAPTITRDGKTVVTRWFQLVGYAVGDQLVTSPPVRYRLPGEDLTEAPSDEILISIASLLAREPNATDIRDIKPPQDPPINWRPYYVLAGALAALLLVAYGGYRVLRRPGRSAAGPPPRPAHEIAHEELARLRARDLPEQGAFKEYYSALTAIVRSYLEQRFRLRAPEMTTEEFLLVTARGAAALQSGHRALLGDFLGESDLVKFARHHPTLADAERAYGAAARFVDETAARASSSPAERSRASG